MAARGPGHLWQKANWQRSVVVEQRILMINICEFSSYAEQRDNSRTFV